MVDLRELIQKVIQAKDKSELQNLKTEFLGKNSQISQEFKKLGSLPEDQRKTRASALNNEKQKITEAINNRFKELEKSEINQKLQKDKVDVTLPARELPNGKIHPVSQVIDEISSMAGGSVEGYAISQDKKKKKKPTIFREEDEIEEDRGVRGQPGTNYPSARNADDDTNEYPAEPKYKIAKEQSEVEEIANYLLEAGVFIG